MVSNRHGSVAHSLLMQSELSPFLYIYYGEINKYSVM